MAYDKTRPRDDDFVKQSAKLIRDNFEGLRTEGIVFPKPTLYGAGAPAAALGETFDRYIDTATGNKYYKSPSGWVRVTNLGSIYKTSAGVYYSTGTPDNSIGAVGDLCFGEGSLAQRIYIKEASGWVQKFLIPKGSERYQDLGSVSGTKNINATNGTLVKMTIAGTTTITLTAALESGYGCTFALLMRKGGAYTVNWPALVAWAGGTAPTFSETETDVITLTTVNGSDWVGTVAGATAEEEDTPGDTFVFTSSGTITAPSWATHAIVSGCGGGGAGGGYYGAGGGAGGHCIDYPIAITPGASYEIVVGAGGIGTNANGAAGGDTKFGNIFILGGGKGGTRVTTSGSMELTVAGATGASPTENGYTQATVATYNRVSGGSGFFGIGGKTVGQNSQGQSATGYGSGGSGSTGGNSGYIGGRGTPGIMIIRWARL